MLDVLVKILVILGYCCLLVVGFIHIDNIGSALKFPPDSAEFHDDTNSGYRTAFKFTPTNISQHWSPILFGLVPLLGQFERLRWDFVMQSYLRFAVFTAFVTVFACLGYSGGLGIICGIYLAVVFLILVILALVKNEGPLSFNLALPGGGAAKTAPASSV